MHLAIIPCSKQLMEISLDTKPLPPAPSCTIAAKCTDRTTRRSTMKREREKTLWFKSMCCVQTVQHVHSLFSSGLGAGEGSTS